MSLSYLFYSQQQRNNFRDAMKEEPFQPPKYDVEIYLTDAENPEDRKIVLVTETMPFMGSTEASKFDDCYFVGSAPNNEAACLVDHYKVTAFGEEIAAQRGIPATFDALYTEAVKNLPRQEVSRMAQQVSYALSHDR
ncbi:MAG: hypothetical protein IPO54_11020 [Micavibrio sp.]|nr:hypothetical protein [Micavibrio sp.]